jgi:hypothetical protein
MSEPTVNLNGQTFTEEWISVGDLEVDNRVQRDHLDLRKVERIKANFNPGALGILTVSRRNRVTNIVLDGMHRKQAVAELTDGMGKMLCHVFTGLTLAEEAQMFLDLNAGSQPNLLDKFKARLWAEDPVAVDINRILRGYGWDLGPTKRQGSIAAPGAIERIYRRSLLREEEPNALQMAVLTVTRAWGTGEPGAVRGELLEGIAAMYSRYGDKLDVDTLIKVLGRYKGGPVNVYADAQQLAALKKTSMSMAVAERVVDEYNKGRKSRSLTQWGWRRP